MKKQITVVICDKCGEDVTDKNGGWRSEKEYGVEKHYCNDCVYKYGHECSVCGDTFIDLAAHNVDGLI